MEENRLSLFRISLYTAMVSLLAGAFWLQIIQGPVYRQRAESNRIRLIPLAAPRGIIYDRSGSVVVDNIPTFTLLALPQELDDPHEIFSKLAELMDDYSANDLMAAYHRRYSTPFSPVTIARDISRQEAFRIAEQEHHLGGILVEPTFRRHYRLKTVAAHVIGYLGLMNAQQYSHLRDYGYRMRETVGKAGLEASYNAYLRGIHGGMQVEVNNRGHQVRLLGKREPEKGKSLSLTIDSGLSEYIAERLKAYRGCVIIMNPHSGAILAMESSPSFDPTVFVQARTSSQRREVLNDVSAPLLSRAYQAAYPPGSLFKVIVATAGLEMGQLTTSQRFNCQGHLTRGGQVFHCWMREGHGSLNLTEALIQSCNVFFFNVGLNLGVEQLYAWATRFGLGQKTGIDLPGEASGVVPHNTWKLAHYNARWYEGDTINFSIGQGYLLATPLQMICAVSVIANGGALVHPYIVQQVGSVAVQPTRRLDLGLDPYSLSVIKKGLQGVVERSYGTGHRVFVEGLSIAAKTGTAQSGRKKNHGWIYGFSPVEKPVLAFLVFLEHGGSGGAAASELAGDILTYARDHGFIPSS